MCTTIESRLPYFVQPFIQGISTMIKVSVVVIYFYRQSDVRMIVTKPFFTMEDNGRKYNVNKLMIAV